MTKLFDKVSQSLLDAIRGVVSEAKLDPVNHAELKGTHAQRKDKDIDNDGDVDNSDEYLHNRRKAIKHAMKKKMKEEIDQIDEISGDMKSRYKKAASQSMDQAQDFKSELDHEGEPKGSRVRKDVNRIIKNRKIGMKRANEEAEGLDELSTGTMRSYMAKASDARGHRKLSTKKVDNRYAGVQKASSKLAKEEAGVPFEGPYKKVGDRKDEYGNTVRNVAKHLAKKAMNKQKNEEVEQVDELSKKTLGSYVVKSLAPGSEKSVSNLASKGGYKLGKARDDDYTAGEKEDAKSVKRSLGVLTAVRKMTKEDAEQVNEISKATMGRYINKAKDSIDTASYRQGNREALGGSSRPLERKLSKRHKGISMAVDKLTKEEIEMIEAKLAGVAPGSMEGDKHMCATKVFHNEWAEGTPIKTMHADPDANGLIEWYDVMFDHGIERVMSEDMEVLQAESHMHSKKKMKEDAERVDEMSSKMKMKLGLYGKKKKKMKEEAEDDKLSIAIKKKLSDEGGAAAFKPLKDTAMKMGIKLTPEMLKNMPGVEQHDDGDYILDESTLDELSTATLRSYRTKARDDAYDAADVDDDRRLRKRSMGSWNAGRKILKRGDALRKEDAELGEEIDADLEAELKATRQTTKSIRGSSRGAMGRAVKKQERNLAQARMDRAARKMGEETEQVDEVSKNLMLRYVSKAKQSAAVSTPKTFVKRMRGTDLAVRKYTARDNKYVRVPATEEVDLDEARGRPKKAGQMDYTVHPRTKEKLMHNNPTHMKRIEMLQKNKVLDKPKTEANQHIMNQLQKAKTSMLGGSTIQFTHGQAKHVSGTHAAKLLSKYAGMKPDEKEAFQKKISHSHEQLMKHV